MPQKTMIERRQHPRYAVSCPAECRLFDGPQLKEEEKGKTFTASIANMGLGGLFLEINPLAPGTLLKIRWTLPGGERSFSAFAEVIWNNDRGCGNRFLAIREEDQAVLQSQLNRFPRYGW